MQRTGQPTTCSHAESTGEHQRHKVGVFRRRAACLRARAPFIVALQPVISHQGCRDLPVIRGVGPAAFGQSHMRAVDFTDIAGHASTRRQSNPLTGIA
jgi:hypothetical protein